jgi:hypothetical protein
MAHGVECASLVPAVDGSGGFPRAWRDTNHRHRGTAWLFFPSHMRGGGGGGGAILDGLWGDGDGDAFTIVMVPPPPSPSGGAAAQLLFRVQCVEGDGGLCDPVNPGRNGTLWHTGNGSLDLGAGAGAGGGHAALLRLDNGVVMRGSFNAGYGNVSWSSGEPTVAPLN